MLRKILVAAALALATMASAHAEETRLFTDALGREVNIPANPKRIAALHDLTVTVPLLELGVTPVGSLGRNAPDGSFFIRGARTLTGVDFANSDIVNLGSFPVDVEAVAALDPDLIITTVYDNTSIEQLETIAPTIVTEDNMRGDFVLFDDYAEITGTGERLKTLKTRYAGQIAQIRELADTSKISVAVFGPHQGQIVAWHTYGAIGKVLRDAGFRSPAIVDAIPGSDRKYFSAEELKAFDADFIITTYDMRSGLSPKDLLEEFEALVPGFCQHLHACRNGQFIMLPREDAVTRSFEALTMMSSVVTAMLGKPFVPYAEE